MNSANSSVDSNGTRKFERLRDVIAPTMPRFDSTVNILESCAFSISTKICFTDRLFFYRAYLYIWKVRSSFNSGFQWVSLLGLRL